MIKTAIIFLCVVMLGLTLCQQKMPDPIKKQLKQNEDFWKQRMQLITKENISMEFPIKKNTTISEKRINRIYIDNMQCQFEVLVDDVLLLKTMGEITKNGGGMTGDHDINQLLLTSGKHEIKVRMYPKFNQQVFGDEGYVNLTFSSFTRETFKKPVYDQHMNGHNGIHIDQREKQWIEKWDQENQVGYAGDYVAKQPDKFKGLPIYEWRSTFDAEVPFDFVGWRNAVNLKQEEDDEKVDIKKEIFDQYKKIHEIFSKRDVSAYLNLVKDREDLIMKALYYSENEKKLRELEVVRLMQDADYELEPLYKETFQLDYQAYGKLITIINRVDGEGVIRLRNKNNQDDVICMDFKFQRKKKADELSVI